MDFSLITGSLVLFAVTTVPPAIICYPLYQTWSLERKSQRQRAQEQHLRAVKEKDQCLYRLIKYQKGRVTLLEFAIKSGLPPEEARQHLDLRASELDAQVEIDARGKVIYQFML